MQEVKDPALLAQLNSAPPQMKEVTDPSLLSELNSEQSPIESAARGALRNFPAAQQLAAAAAPYNPLSQEKTYGKELEHLTRAAEQGKEQNPVSYGAGAVAGSLAPLAIPVVGEGLMAAPIAGNAALGALQSASDTNLVEHPGQAASEAALGAGIGAVAGGVGKGLQNLAPDAAEIAASSTAKGMGSTARRLLPIMGKNPEEELSEVGRWLNTAKTDAGEPLIGLTKRPDNLLKGVQNVHDAAGKKISDIIDEVAPDMIVPKGNILSELKPIAADLEIIDPQGNQQVLGLMKRIRDLDKAGRLDFDTLYSLKATAWKMAEKNSSTVPAYGVISDYINGMVEQYGMSIENPAIKAAYDLAKLDYKNSSNVLKILRYATAKDIASGPLGNAGLLGMFGLASGFAAGHPVAGIASMAGSAVGRPMMEMLGKNVLLKSVPYAPAIAGAGRGLNKAAQAELTNALQSKFGKKQP